MCMYVCVHANGGMYGAWRIPWACFCLFLLHFIWWDNVSPWTWILLFSLFIQIIFTISCGHLCLSSLITKNQMEWSECNPPSWKKEKREGSRMVGWRQSK